MRCSCYILESRLFVVLERDSKHSTSSLRLKISCCSMLHQVCWLDLSERNLVLRGNTFQSLLGLFIVVHSRAQWRCQIQTKEYMDEEMAHFWLIKRIIWWGKILGSYCCCVGNWLLQQALFLSWTIRVLDRGIAVERSWSIKPTTVARCIIISRTCFACS